MMVIMTFTKGMAFGATFVLLNLLLAQFIEIFFYDGWLWILSKCNCPRFFLCLCLTLGWFWGSISLSSAYLPSDIAVLGHHVILLGMLNFFVDFLKHVAIFNIKRQLCPETSSDGALLVYEPMKSELTHVLPEDLKPTE